MAARGARGGGPQWRRAAGTGVLAAGALYGAGLAAGAARLTPLAVVVICVALAGGSIVAGLLIMNAGPWAAYTGACGTVASAWLGFAAAAAPGPGIAAVALVIPAAALAAAYPKVAAREADAARRASEAADAAAAAASQRRWPELLGRIGHQGVMFAGREETLAGYLVHLRLPGSGRVTYSGLVPSTEALEVAARLRHGSLRFERGTHAHQVVLHVAERDVLAETVPLPPSASTLSITAPLPVGLFEDGQLCAVTLREVAALIVGLRGSGKSNLLNVLLAQLARCPDVLIFAIDLKGGRMAAPWIEPWLAGRADRPIVDWLATDRDEAERMLRACLRAVQARSRSGSGGEKISPSPRQPAILLVCDEIAVILGMGTGGPRSSLGGTTNAALAGLVTQLVMTGRSEAIDLIMATQRGTVTMLGSADLKSQCALRIGLGVSSEADARLIIPDDVRIAADLARLRHPGTGIVQQGKTGRVLPAKFYRIEHHEIGAIAERYGSVRPGPDKLLEEALGEDYQARWSAERVARIPGIGTAARPLPAGPAAGSAGQDRPGDPDGRGDPAGDAARERMTSLLRSAGVRGMTVPALAGQLAAAGHVVGQDDIQCWLAQETAAGRVQDASFGRWKWAVATGPADS